MIHVVLIGCVHSSRVALDSLNQLPDKVQVVGLITRRASAYNSDFEDLSAVAKSIDCPVLYVEDWPTDEAQAIWVRTLSADIIFCIGWSRLLGPLMLNITRYGVIGYHPAALPSNRGRHPIVWAIALGLHQTASCFFEMDQGVDSGPLVSQVQIPISFEDDAQSLYLKICNSIKLQVRDIINSIVENTYHPVPQDHSQANYWRKRNEADGAIDWRMNADSIYNLVRALTKPYPGAHTMFEGTQVKIWRCHPLPCDRINVEPGRVIANTISTFTVKCGGGAIEVLAHEFLIIPAVGKIL